MRMGLLQQKGSRSEGKAQSPAGHAFGRQKNWRLEVGGTQGRRFSLSTVGRFFAVCAARYDVLFFSQDGAIVEVKEKNELLRRHPYR